MIVVSDTSPIINLAAIGQLDLLEKLYARVIIPQAVYDEIVVVGAGQPGAHELPQLTWIEVRQVADASLIASLLQELDPGEASAIALAIEISADKILIDEHRGRLIAEQHKLSVTGLLGALINAKQQGYISSVKVMMDDLIAKAGFWIDSQLYQRVLQLVGE